MTTLIEIISQTLKLPSRQVEAALTLMDEGNTLPFIARYRKERTGSLDEEQLRQIEEYAKRLRALAERRETIRASITEQGKLTPELEAQLDAAQTLTALEDLYLPYKPKRRTRASIARERGLEPLAEMIVAQVRGKASADELARGFLSEAVPTAADALAGARDIVAETISDDAEIRGAIREKALRFGTLLAEKSGDDPKGTYETYYEFSRRVTSLKPHQVLALNRGEAENMLKLRLDLEERDTLDPVLRRFRPDDRSTLADQLRLAAEDAVKRLILPAIERDVRRALSETAEQHAMDVFAQNLRGLLSQPPLAGRVVLGLDPGYRTGTKLAIIDVTGKVLATGTIYPHAPQNEWRKSQDTLRRLIDAHGVTLITIGNGTASRETESLVAELTRDRPDVHYLIVNEAGASVYSASPLARAELPDLDVSIRGAVSIARRAQDPLAELVKIDPKSIGVGLYQHDVNQKQLGETLGAVVESVVNHVGVDLNTASPALLTYVSGIGGKLAQNIVSYRDQIGRFPNRKALKKVSGLGPKAFEQAAGFLRVRESDHPLDASAIHPESYTIAEKVLQRAKISFNTPPAERESALRTLRDQITLTQLAEELGTGVPTLTDIFEQLIRPGRDPREDLSAPILRSDVLKMEDLQAGMVLAGTVRNVVDFGAFIDIGVKQDGLLHKSQIPFDLEIGVGDILDVVILNVDEARGRISLGMA